MGRELRRVPADWQHPRDTNGRYIPLYDENYDERAARWLQNALLWSEGKHPDQATSEAAKECRYYWEWSGDPPDPESYRKRKWTPEEATAYQVYENVTEGTPVSPVLLSEEGVMLWLTSQGYSHEAAEAFLETKWAPSGVAFAGGYASNIHALDLLKPAP